LHRIVDGDYLEDILMLAWKEREERAAEKRVVELRLERSQLEHKLFAKRLPLAEQKEMNAMQAEGNISHFMQQHGIKPRFNDSSPYIVTRQQSPRPRPETMAH
jgi:hypothetical protein